MAVKQPTIFTTGQVAKLCAVSIRTVARWIEMDHLKAFRLPGTGSEYRVVKKDLIDFMEKYNLPTDHIEEDTGYKILVIDNDPKEIRFIREAMYDLKLDYTFYEFTDFIEGLINIGLIKPHLVLFDFDYDKSISKRLYEYIQNEWSMKNIRIILLTKSKVKELTSMNVTGFSFILRRPLDQNELVKKSTKLLKKASLK